MQSKLVKPELCVTRTFSGTNADPSVKARHEKKKSRWALATALSRRLADASAISQASKCVSSFTFRSVQWGFFLEGCPSDQAKPRKVLVPRSRQSRYS